MIVHLMILNHLCIMRTNVCIFIVDFASIEWTDMKLFSYRWIISLVLYWNIMVVMGILKVSD